MSKGFAGRRGTPHFDGEGGNHKSQFRFRGREGELGQRALRLNVRLSVESQVSRSRLLFVPGAQ